mmetsp:Transcript_27056/g.56354  ORF Transcript_27056/g.56354 Transcript_27056/m.56354 type:complete len:235 (-) Transcript_27056:219-923(-)
MDDVFTQSKIKAQIRQEEAIGRVSSKALDLIAACSALFVRDLVEQENGNDNENNNNNKNHGPSNSTTTKTRRTRSSSRKRKCIDKSACAKDTPSKTNDGPSIINLTHIKKRIDNQPEYEFLDGVLDESLTENNAYKYDAAARRRNKAKEKSCSIPSGRSKSKSKSKQQKAAAEVGGTESTSCCVVGSLKGDNTLDSDIVSEGDTALQAAIEEAASSAAGADGTKEIMEDEDDYD